MAVNAIFRYKATRGILQRLPAGLKLLLFLPLSAFCFSLPLPFLASAIAALALLASLCGFSPGEQFCDLKPAAFYALLMYTLSVFSALLEAREAMPPSSLAIALFMPKRDFLLSALRLAVIVQLSALLFRSTSSLEIREALAGLERRIRCGLSRIPLLQKISLKPRAAQSIALFAGFIPEIFATWAQLDLAWAARGGKPDKRKIRTLVFALISLSFEKASRKATALAARS
jgi:biotin transport system permease protein/energy-coupling factor transport system permease protein